jgi:hypothetical protein
MTQLIVNIEDVSLLSELKRAISKMPGVGSISEKKAETLNNTTMQALEDAEAGKTIKCENFEEYLELVK